MCSADGGHSASVRFDFAHDKQTSRGLNTPPAKPVVLGGGKQEFQIEKFERCEGCEGWETRNDRKEPPCPRVAGLINKEGQLTDYISNGIESLPATSHFPA